MQTADGRPIRATSVFYVDHSDVRVPRPVRVSIDGLRIKVPRAARMSGVSVFGHEVTLGNLRIEGSPKTGVVVGAGAKGLGGLTARIEVRNCSVLGAERDAMTIFGPIGLRVEGNTLLGAHGAGLRIRAADRGQPTLDVHVVHNVIRGNGGPGIVFDLDPPSGPPVFASGIEISANVVERNAAGIVLAGGQNDGKGTATLAENVVRGNRGPGLLGRRLRLALQTSDNDLRGNRGGAASGLHTESVSRPPRGAAWVARPQPVSGPRDDTAWLQARLDRRGGTIFLPRLPNGECYATRGLWVSHDYTTITSDGACVVSLGLGSVRLRSNDGDPIAASAVFFVNRSRPKAPAPLGVTISNLRIVVPEPQGLYGVAVFGHETTLDHLEIGGAPKDDVLVSGRANANAYVGRVAILNSRLSGAQRNAISAVSVIDLRIEGNVIETVRDSPPGQPAAGIDLEPDDRSQPALGVRILRNTIQDNAGPGLLLELDSNEGPAVLASNLEISDNTVVRNAWKLTPPKRAGIVLVGGQDGGAGTLALKRNVIRDNGGPGILSSRLTLIVDARDNELVGNASF
jgi:hypothetical protein